MSLRYQSMTPLYNDVADAPRFDMGLCDPLDNLHTASNGACVK